MTVIEAHLICKNCGHRRDQHGTQLRPGDRCLFMIRSRFHPSDPQEHRCPCPGFEMDAEEVPVFEYTEEQARADEDFLRATNPVTLTAAAAVAHIDRGGFDPYLELILAAGHNRKRALRGVKGFPRMGRS